MRDFLDVDAEMGAHASALDEIYQQLARGELVVGISVALQQEYLSNE